MKVKRIKEIKNVGTFANFANGRAIGFEKLTFIYGFNTFGKTTLSDIFQSLKSNDSFIIKERKTIPEIQSDQKISISVLENGTSEVDIIFNGENWSTNKISSYLEVFGTDFIHKNVFTGLTIQRENKENLTNFILGDQGVLLAAEIKAKKKLLGEKRRELKISTPQYVKKSKEEEINDFIKYNVKNLKLSDIDNQLAGKTILLKKEKDRLKKPTNITNLSEPDLYSPDKTDLVKIAKNINDLLKTNYLGIKKENIKKLQNHVLKNFTSINNSKNWIQQGLGYCKSKHGGDCPFCGQSLRKARELIKLYDSYFDTTYSNYINKIKTEITTNLSIIKNGKLNNQTKLQTALIRVKQYKDLIQEKDFQDKLIEYENNVDTLKEQELEDEKIKIIEALESKIEEKIKSPYEKFDSVDISNIRKLFKTYIDKVSKSYSLIEFFLKKISTMKKKYQVVASIEKAILELKEEILKLEQKKARIEQDEECLAYKTILKDINEIENGKDGIKILSEKLQKDQTEFLEKYFTIINTLFNRFGSRNFALHKGEDRKGHMPVYFLKVKFHNKEIPPDKICNVFSESDRRALALAIFFAHIELKEENEIKKTIIILDDPNTSFDDNRVTNSINYFKEVMNRCSQLIILTHYVHFIKRFCQITRKQLVTEKFIDINQDKLTSFLSSSNRSKFTSSEYEKTFMKIYGFINRTHTNDIKTYLRPFLEDMYLPTVFSKKIHDNNIDCSSLEKMINGIFSNNKTVKEKFHEFRVTLNPDSHLFTNNNKEDVRNFADDMLTYLYSININT